MFGDYRRGHCPSGQRLVYRFFEQAKIREIAAHQLVFHEMAKLVLMRGLKLLQATPALCEVANAHAWGSWGLTFSDGTTAACALLLAHNPSTITKGIASYGCN